MGDDQIEIRRALPSDHQRVLDFLRAHYYPEEPLTAGSEPRQQDAEDEAFNMSNIEHGTCLVALQRPGDDGGDEVVVGAILAGPKDGHEAEHLVAEAARLGPTKWGRILALLAVVERDADVCGRLGVDRALHGHVLAIDGRLRGRRLGERLVRELMALGRERGFPVLTADCTSVFSARIFERLGGECLNTLRYSDHRDDQGQPVFRPPPPHDCVRTFALRL